MKNIFRVLSGMISAILLTVSLPGQTFALSSPVIASFTATPTTINLGQSTTLSWRFGEDVPTSVSINNGVGDVTLLSSKVVTPKINTTYTLSATNSSGTVTKQLSVFVKQPAPIISSFTANPAGYITGQPVTLSWTLAGGAVSALILDNNIGSVMGKTSLSVALTKPTTYTLTAINAAGVVTKQLLVTQAKVSTPEFSPRGGTYNNSVSVALSSQTQGASIYYTLDGTTPTVSSSVYTAPFVLTNSAVVKAIAFKAGVIGSDIAVSPQFGIIKPPVITSYYANPNPAPAGSPITLNWVLTGDPADYVSIDNGVGNVTGMTSKLVTPPYTYTYFITAKNSAGQVTMPLEVEVTRP